MTDNVTPFAPGSPIADQRLQSICVLELLKKDIKPRELILAPWLRERDLAMIHAYRGVGKTYLSLTIALAVAAGGEFMSWNAPKPRRVLLIDGEMPEGALQDRSRDLINAHKWKIEPGAFQIIAQDSQDTYIPSLATVEGQAAVGEHLEGVDLLVIDNLSTLASDGPENDAESWSSMQAWILALRKAGVSVIMIHHSGKSGQQRGTSRREDVLDVVIGLKKPADYDASQGARFEVVFEKARGLAGDDVKTFEAQLRTGHETATWTCQSMEEASKQKIIGLLEDGEKAVDIAKTLGVSRQWVSKVKRQRDHELT